MDENAALAALALWQERGDAASRDACLTAWLPLVKRVWARLKVGLPPSAEAWADDILQCGALGLLQAMHSWKPDSAPFEVWARLRVRGAMLDELRRQDPLTKEHRRRWKALRRSMEALEQRLQRPCGEEEWARHLGITVEALREELLKNAKVSIVFLDTLDAEGGLSLKERLADPAADPADAALLKAELKDALSAAIGRLPDRERTLLVLLLREELGHKEAALVLGVTPGRISQIYAKAILHLQAALAVKLSL